MFRFYVSYFLILAFGYLAVSQNSELLSVVVLFRHGDRSPVSTYINDPYNSSYWPMGWGQLTNIGKRRHYQLGKWFRQTYADFLPEKYSPENLRVQSSNIDRCLMSASSHLAGLYPPVDDQVWNTNLNWQPLPIHTSLPNQDPVLAQDKPCPKFTRLYSELMQTDEFQNLLSDDVFAYVSQNSGENISSLVALSTIYNTLYIERLNNLTLPQWTDDVYLKMEEIANATFATVTYTSDLARLNAGPLIDYIASHFENYLSGVPDTAKYLILSGHDATIASLLGSLGLYDLLWPEYASAVILELRQQANKEFVNILYKNSTLVKTLTLQSCDFDCDFTSFQNITLPLRLNQQQWEGECSEK